MMQSTISSRTYSLPKTQPHLHWGFSQVLDPDSLVFSVSIISPLERYSPPFQAVAGVYAWMISWQHGQTHQGGVKLLISWPNERFFVLNL